MKKILVLLFAIFAVSQFASAAYTNDDLVIETRDGKTVAYRLSDRPVVTFEVTDLVLTAKGVQVKYPVTDVKEIRFAEEFTSVNATTASGIMFTVNDNEIIANGLDKNDTLEVYGVDGKAIATVGVNAQGAASANISELGHGVYVVKAGKKTYKIIK